uniref:Uncharacterized protein n=1 Tax=Glossina brevipalpis TaxID=37001 RepID=A0A1A9WFS6_9MUSC
MENPILQIINFSLVTFICLFLVIFYLLSSVVHEVGMFISLDYKPTKRMTRLGYLHWKTCENMQNMKQILPIGHADRMVTVQLISLSADLLPANFGDTCEENTPCNLMLLAAYCKSGIYECTDRESYINGSCKQLKNLR